MQKSMILCFLAALSLASATEVNVATTSRTEVTPVEKVIKLLEDLKDEVIQEGKDEAKAYDKFACFCKEANGEKSDGITEGQTSIDETSALLQEKTALMNKLTDEIAQLQKDIEELEAEMAQKEEVRAKEKAKYEAIAADLNRAKAAGEKAIELLEGAKGGAASFAEVKETIRKSVALADALDLSPRHQRQLNAFLQEDEGDGVPESDYDNHSGDIITMIQDLVKEFTDKEMAVTAEEEKAVDAHTKYMNAATDSMDEMKEDKEQKEEKKETTIGEIAEAQESLLDLQAELKDNQFYMKDLTAQCEIRAKEWDQQTASRAGEIGALTQALTIMQERVQGKDVVNQRALLQTAPAKAETPVARAAPADLADDDFVGDLSFLQTGGASTPAAVRSLRGVSTHLTDGGRQQVIMLLQDAGIKIGSTMLTSLASQIQADPFKKVKNLIQNLIERLLKEAAAEATQKGWCDTELGKAKTTRKFQEEKIMDLSVALAKAEALKTQLEEDIEKLTEQIASLNEELSEVTEMRAEEKEDNLMTMKDASEGLAAVRDAIQVLEEFYKGAAKATVLLETDASPVGADAPGGGQSGARKGKQGAGNNIIAILKVIESDFDRTGRKTKEAEHAAHREFVKFNRETKVNIATKETDKKNKEEQLEATKLKIEEDMNDMKKQQKLLDKALKELTALQPACVDTGMDYEERKEKREAEMAALKEACAALMPKDGEPEGNACAFD